MMPHFEDQILAAISHRNYQPLKPKALARKIGVTAPQYADFRRALRSLHRDGRIEMGKNHMVKPKPPHGTITGTYRRTGSGLGFVRPHLSSPSPAGTGEGRGKGGEIRIKEEHSLDAATGDTVLVRLIRKPNRPDLLASGAIVRILERATRQFVGTYFEREGQGLVRVDGTVFSHSVYVGDPGAKGARPDDKVVFEMLRFPTPEDRGEGVITEILGPRGQPGVDTLSIIRAFGLPEAFAEDALQEAREAAAAFERSHAERGNEDIEGREDFTQDAVITIDPAEARDFDDAVSLRRDEGSGHWQLSVHIADVNHFVPPGGPLDREARRRGTSVYLPQRVLPMFPEIISNSLASLQQGRLRYVKSVVIDFTPQGQKTAVHFANGAIRVRRRFTYEHVSGLLEKFSVSRESIKSAADPEVYEMLLRMRDFALILRKRRIRRGALELNMPEAELEYDEQGQIAGAHFRAHDISHQIIEEFMLAANEAVAEHLSRLDVPFLRRVHPDPDPKKLSAFADFARSLGYKIPSSPPLKGGGLGGVDRFTLQRILAKSAAQPEVHAVHYALLRSLKQAVYSPEEEGHYALASTNYCHFTSPIRRYPDLTVHRLLDRWLRTGKCGSDEAELIGLGGHCSKMERRAETAERELIKLKLLTYLSERLGLELEAIITGVADYGFYAQAEQWPVEGLVHISTLTDDYYYFEEVHHSLIGRRTKKRYRLGDKVHVRVVRVDVQRRQMDFRVVRPAPKHK